MAKKVLKKISLKDIKNDKNQIVELQQLRKGVLFRFVDKKKVYEFIGGGFSKGFEYRSTDDISDFFTTKNGNKKVEIGF